jgi:hypothetical protein
MVSDNEADRFSFARRPDAMTDDVLEFFRRGEDFSTLLSNGAMEFGGTCAAMAESLQSNGIM